MRGAYERARIDEVAQGLRYSPFVDGLAKKESTTMKRLSVLLCVIALPLFAGSITRTAKFSQRELAVTHSDASDVVDLAGYPALVNPGAPRVPEVVQSVLIPAGATPTSVELTAEDWVTLPGTYNLSVSQADAHFPVAGQPYAPKVVARDPAIYASNVPYPETKIRLLGVGTMCHYRIAQVELHPIRVIPATGQLQMATRLSYRLNYADHQVSDLIPTIEQKELFGKAVSKLVVNPDNMAGFSPRVSQTRFSVLLPPGHYEYVVITEAPMDTVFQRLADWKTAKGVPGTVVLVSWISSNYTGNDLQEKIRNFIIDAHQNWGTEYVLLGGQGDYLNSGQNIVPTRMANYGPTQGDEPCDLYYGALDGSWDGNGNHVYGETDDSTDMYADAYVGRAPVYTSDMAQVFVRKVMGYEQNPPAGYLKKMLMPTGILWDAYEERPLQESIARMCGPTWTVGRLYERTSALSNSAIRDSVNEGYGMGHWVGHGDQNGIYMTGGTVPVFVASDADALTNGDKLGIGVSIACDCGGWDMPSLTGGDCFAEHLVNNPNGGMIASMMNSRYGYGALDENSQYCIGPSERQDSSFYAAIFGDLYHTGEALGYAKAAWAPYADSLYRYAETRFVTYDLNLFGDPELPLWTNEPGNASVQHNPVVALGQNVPFTVTVLDQGHPVKAAMVNLKKGTEVNMCGLTDSTGSVTLLVSTLTPGEMYMLTSAHNYYNQKDSVLVASAVYLAYRHSGISDLPPGGNGDSILNPGETVRMPVWVMNWGNQPASGVTATLRSLDPCAVVTDSVKSLGNIPARDSALTAGSGFEFRLSDTCSNCHEIPFQIRCRDSRDSTWTSIFTTKVGKCILEYAAKRVNDPRPGGNANGRLDAGETDQLFLILRDTGAGHAYNVQAVLRSYDPLFTITDSVSAYTLVRSDTTGENTAHPFVVHIDGTVAPETQFPCSLLLSSPGDHYSARLPIAILVGELRPVDPIHDNKTPPLYWAIDNADQGYTGRPDFDWIEARGHNCLHIGPDSNALITLPSAFGPFKMYGQRYTFLTACSNGWLCGGITSNTNGNNSPLPSSGLPGSTVCANWDELNPTTGNNVWTLHDVANHLLVIEYDSVPYADTTLGADKFEIVIYDTTLAASDGNNKIVVQYLTANGFRSSTVGIQDPTKTFGINCLYDSAYNRGSSAIRPHSAIQYTADASRAGVDETRVQLKTIRFGVFAAQNPFHGPGRIMCSLPAAVEARLSVYDASGRAIRTYPIPKSPVPTLQSLTWDGRDAAGRTAAGGIYFYRLESKQDKAACKVIKLD